jgi:hypothetical protein
VLAGKPSQFGSGSSHERAPRRPVLEIGDRMVGKIRPKHVSHRLRVEYTAEWDQQMQLGSGAGLAASEGDAARMVELPRRKAAGFHRSTSQWLDRPVSRLPYRSAKSSATR